jgi:hypothetical protein
MTVASIAERLSRVIPAWRVGGRLRHRRWRLGLGIAAALVVLVVIASYLVDEPLRQRMEGELNRRLDGYTVHLGRHDSHPLGFGITLGNITIVQQQHPDPPVAFIPELEASVQLYERLVGGLSKLLENRPRDEVATKATISGPTGDVKASTAEVILRLLQNAFFRAILPGFDEELGRRR